MNSAVTILIDKLMQKNINMTYSGDMDINGLLIANRLLSIYPNIPLLHMNFDNFNNYAINVDKPKSKNKIQNIKDPSLKQIAENIVNTNRVCYQEALFHKY